MMFERFTDQQIDRLRDRQREGWAVAFPWASQDALIENLLVQRSDAKKANAEVERLRELVQWAGCVVMAHREGDREAMGAALATLAARMEADDESA